MHWLVHVCVYVYVSLPVLLYRSPLCAVLCVKLPPSALLGRLRCSDLSLREDVWRDKNTWLPGEEMESLRPISFCCYFFFFLTLILCLRSSCGNSCLTLNKEKSLFLSPSLPEAAPPRKRARKQLSAAANTTSPNTEEALIIQR